MTEQENTYYQIEDYIQGNLNPSDSERIKYLIDSDPVYKDIYEEINLNNHVVIGASFARLRKKMQADLETIEQKRIKQKRRIKNTGLTIGVLGLLSSILFLINPDETQKSTAPIDSVSTESTGQPLQDGEHNQPLDDSTLNSTKEETPKFPAKLINGTFQPDNETRKSIVADTVIYKSDTQYNIVAKQTEDLVKTSPEEHEKTNASAIPKEKSIADNYTKTACDSIIAEFVTSPSCQGQNTGKIVISGIKGGEMPYYIYVGDEDISSSYEAQNLKPGWYTLKIYDHKRCSSTKKIQVLPERCFDNQEFSFNPDFGETWMIPVKSEQAGYLKIIARSGKIVYESRLEKDGPNEWKGIDKTGKIVEYGMYICLLEYEDGHVEKIQVTIIR